MGPVILNEPAHPERDYLYRMARLREKNEPPKTHSKRVKVSVEVGPPDGSTKKRQRRELTLFYNYDQPFVFAVYADNPGFHDLDRGEWEVVAKSGIEKFCAQQGRDITTGPMREATQPYNLMAEVRGVIEWHPETLARIEERKRLDAEREADIRAATAATNARIG